jgi:hypothetical protein
VCGEARPNITTYLGISDFVLVLILSIQDQYWYRSREHAESEQRSKSSVLGQDLPLGWYDGLGLLGWNPNRRSQRRRLAVMTQVHMRYLVVHVVVWKGSERTYSVFGSCVAMRLASDAHCSSLSCSSTGILCSSFVDGIRTTLHSCAPASCSTVLSIIAGEFCS